MPTYTTQQFEARQETQLPAPVEARGQAAGMRDAWLGAGARALYAICGVPIHRDAAPDNQKATTIGQGASRNTYSPFLYTRNPLGSKINSWPENSNAETECNRPVSASVIKAPDGGKMRITIIPAYSWGGNRKILEKPRSWVIKIRDSFFARAATSPSGAPRGGRIASWPERCRNSSTSRRTFSSIRNFGMGRNGKRDVSFTNRSRLCGEHQSSADRFSGKLGVCFDNILNGLARAQHFQNKMNHDTSPLKTGLPVAYIWINGDIIIHGNSLSRDKCECNYRTAQRPEVPREKIPAMMGDGLVCARARAARPRRRCAGRNQKAASVATLKRSHHISASHFAGVRPIKQYNTKHNRKCDTDKNIRKDVGHSALFIL